MRTPDHVAWLLRRALAVVGVADPEVYESRGYVLFGPMRITVKQNPSPLLRGLAHECELHDLNSKTVIALGKAEHVVRVCVQEYVGALIDQELAK